MKTPSKKGAESLSTEDLHAAIRAERPKELASSLGGASVERCAALITEDATFADDLRFALNATRRINMHWYRKLRTETLLVLYGYATTDTLRQMLTHRMVRMCERDYIQRIGWSVTNILGSPLTRVPIDVRKVQQLLYA